MVTGCSAIPDVAYKPQYRNPFPQLHRVAVLPFYNQSEDPHVNQDDVALAYYHELQQIPGFEVMPVGVVKRLMQARGTEPHSGPEFQQLARDLGVDAVVVGSVTEFSPYYPPRVGLAVNWYAANPGFHPIPPGYGLPWGTPGEDDIPSSLVFESEFALAQAQLKTQTPKLAAQTTAAPDSSPVRQASYAEEDWVPIDDPLNHPSLPADWPDASGLAPGDPSPLPPELMPQFKPVITHTRVYNGSDEDVTEALSKYYQFRDDARFGGWQAYLQRSDDFIRFCCHMHIAETLAARGGAGKTRLVLRWPISRYDP